MHISCDAVTERNDIIWNNEINGLFVYDRTNTTLQYHQGDIATAYSSNGMLLRCNNYSKLLWIYRIPKISVRNRPSTFLYLLRL